MSFLGEGSQRNGHNFSDGGQNTLKTNGEQTRESLLGRQKRPFAVEILAWLEAHASDLVIQRLAPGRRQKNRCIVQFRDRAGEMRVVGGTTIAGAVWRAQIRLDGPETAFESDGENSKKGER